MLLLASCLLNSIYYLEANTHRVKAEPGFAEGLLKHVVGMDLGPLRGSCGFFFFFCRAAGSKSFRSGGLQRATLAGLVPVHPVYVQSDWDLGTWEAG